MRNRVVQVGGVVPGYNDEPFEVDPCGVEMSRVRDPAVEENRDHAEEQGVEKPTVKQLLDDARVGDGNDLIGCGGAALARSASMALAVLTRPSGRVQPFGQAAETAVMGVPVGGRHPRPARSRASVGRR